eukprot:s914_g13.t1
MLLPDIQQASSQLLLYTASRPEITSSYESLNFAGDGRPGVGDVLEDARWESAWGVDGGVLLLGTIQGPRLRLAIVGGSVSRAAVVGGY